jgi:hypothetical protein
MGWDYCGTVRPDEGRSTVYIKIFEAIKRKVGIAYKRLQLFTSSPRYQVEPGNVDQEALPPAPTRGRASFTAFPGGTWERGNEAASQQHSHHTPHPP